MRIGLNLLNARPEMGGAWNYIKNIVSLLERFDKENEYVVYCTSISQCLVGDKQNFRKVNISIPIKSQVYRVLYENTLLVLRGITDRIDLMHWFANTQAFFNVIAGVVTVHDLLMFNDPRAYGILNGAYYRFMVARTAKNAILLAPVSETTAQDISKRFNVPEESISVIRNALSEEFGRAALDEVSRFRHKYRLPQQFWLYVAHYYPHKNHQRLFSAYAKLKLQQPATWPLVLCGEKNKKDELITRLLIESGCEKDVIWLPRLSDGEMPILYSAATALVFPSLFEGGGIPVMEAMGCGCPVVASDIPTTREFAGESVLFFNPLDIESIITAMQIFQNDSSFRYRCRQQGLEKVEEYRPHRIFDAIMNAYKTAYNFSVGKDKSKRNGL
jgi:glycosyltransferase involved in cell wall biosynthesis